MTEQDESAVWTEIRALQQELELLTIKRNALHETRDRLAELSTALTANAHEAKSIVEKVEELLLEQGEV